MAFGSMFYGSLIGAVAQQIGLIGNFYFPLMASILTWTGIICTWLMLGVYIWLVTRLFQKHWSDDLELYDFSDRVWSSGPATFKNHPLRFLNLSLLILVLIYIGASFAAIALLITTSIFTLLVAITALIARWRLRRITTF